MGTVRKLLAGLLTGILAFVFIIAGAVKITPKISVEAHKMMVRAVIEQLDGSEHIIIRLLSKKIYTALNQGVLNQGLMQKYSKFLKGELSLMAFMYTTMF